MRASPSRGPESEDAPPGRLYLRMVEATVLRCPPVAAGSVTQGSLERGVGENLSV